jgi:pyruvate,water dikinase
MQTRYIYDLGEKGIPAKIGAKAQNLLYLSKEGFSTPKSLVCTWDAYLDYVRQDPGLLDDLSAQLLPRLDVAQRYAVRSSANLEDGIDRSFAGQFESILDVEGIDAMLDAVQRVWDRTRSPSMHTYLERIGKRPDDLKMAVLLQEMVQPVVSGVVFSRNPTNGADEIVIEAVRGSGQALLQDGITPHRWVSRDGHWVTKPETEGIPLSIMDQVVSDTQAIVEAYGKPVDLEWVFDGTKVYWVQLRDITTLRDLTVYSNSISSEVLPGMIKPLVWSINVPLVNGAWIDLFGELIGENDIDPLTLAKSFYHRAYFNMTKIGDIFEELGLPRSAAMRKRGEGMAEGKFTFRPTARSLRHVPRLVRFLIDKWRFARKVERFLPDMRAQYQALDKEPVEQFTPQQLLERIDHLYGLTRQTAYYNIVVPLLMQVHTMRLRRALAQVGTDLESFDARGSVEALNEYDPSLHLGELNRMYRRLAPDQQQRIRQAAYDELATLPGIAPFRDAVERFIAQFGHLSDSGNDFSSTPWRKDPDLVLAMIVEYTPPDKTKALSFQDLELPAAKRARLARLHAKAQQFMLYREAIGSLYTFGYGLFRSHFLLLGKCLVERGSIDTRFDIFYLHLDEIRAAIHDTSAGAGFRDAIAARKHEMDMYRDIVLPEIIYGDEQPPVQRTRQVAQVLHGTATSRGYYRGPVKVIHGSADFSKMAEGDVLVIPYSDVAWTPLFGKAGAVVAESGGMLSHSSVIAREYGIPAVVSVPGACQLPDGAIVSVDGYGGRIDLESTPHARIA